MDSDQTTTAWVPSKTVDGEWHLAKVVAQGEDGQVTLETLDTKETHTQPSDVSGRRRLLRGEPRARPECMLRADGVLLYR